MFGPPDTPTQPVFGTAVLIRERGAGKTFTFAFTG